MIKYPITYNPIMEYWNKIESGEIVVCDKIRRTYRKIVHDMTTHGDYHYSAARANHILEFAENYCHLSKGKSGNKLIRLELWEKALLATIFGFIDDNGLRKYQQAVLIVGKKNGKSAISSIVGLYLLMADGENGPEVYSVATKKDQAKIIWLESRRMVKKSPSLIKRIKPLVAELRCEYNDGVFKPLASDSDTLDGLNVHGVLMDEWHQWRNGRPLYDIMADGITARDQPLIFMTSTAGTIRDDIYDFIYDQAVKTINGYFDDEGYKDERSIYFVYELDSRKEWTDPDCWIKANPGLGTIKNLVTLRNKVEKAKRNPDQVKNLVCKEFNIPETSTAAWMSYDDFNNPAKFDLSALKPRYFIGGADLSSTTDLTAAKAIFQVPDDDNIYVLSMYWIPEDLVERKIREDQIRYDLWIDAGLVRTCPGNKIHHKYVTEWFMELRDTFDIYPLYIGYDAWSATYWVEEMESVFGKSVMIPVRQGKKTLSSPMQLLRRDLEAKRIIYNNNPVDKWCFANTAVEEDRNGNIQPHKTSKSTQRIDGTAALLDAYVVFQEKSEDYKAVI